MIPLTGYTNKLSAEPGGSLEFKISSQSEYSARLIRIICGDPNPDGPGIKYEPADGASFEGTYPGREQSVHLGSYAITQPFQIGGHDGAAGTGVFSISATIFPTLPQCNSQQTIISHLDDHGCGFSLDINEHGTMLSLHFGELLGDVVAQVQKPLQSHTWYRIAAIVDVENGRTTVSQEPIKGQHGVNDTGQASAEWEAVQAFGDKASLVIAARIVKRVAMNHFNGKIESPTLKYQASGEAICSLDFALEQDSPILARDIGPNKWDAELVNVPTRGVTGSTWSGQEHCWRHAPSEYGAIHFHEDDLYDCAWETDFVFRVPDSMASGVYGALLTSNDTVEDIVPFYVRPKRGKPTSDTAFLASTFTYQIYANHQRDNVDDAEYVKRTNEWEGARKWHPSRHPEYGASTYNLHSDGSGICYSSRLRPILTMRPGFLTFFDKDGSGLRHFPADTHILDWFNGIGKDFDVVTDEDLHEEGYDLLKSYKVVLTGAHPEYHTLNTLDALQSYVDGGGHFMYLGGNGFYWRIAANPAVPGLLEIRRGEGGVRAWASMPGEYYNNLDGGSYGGLWRRNGRPPQQLAGVGFSSQGQFEGSCYVRTAASHDDPSVSWIFEGVDGNILGDYGLSGGGAAGFELDRADLKLGSPSNTVVLASSQGKHSLETFIPVYEDMLTHVSCTTGGAPQDLIRADMVYFETANGGAVFSSGSITFCGRYVFLVLATHSLNLL
jgi:N,N-dimethylformamidase